MSKRRDPRYMAIGLHEYGHAENAERSRYPKLRNVSATVSGNTGGGLGAVAGLLGRSRYGIAGGALIGAGVSGLTSLPILIEEHQASKNALRMMKEDGELSDAEYKEAKKTLKTAYKSYVSSALNRAAISGSIGSGNAGAATGLIGGSLAEQHFTHNRIKRDLSDVRGTKKDVRAINRMKKRRGIKADRYHTPIKSGLPNAYYFAPHSSTALGISRKEYKKLMEKKTGSKIRDRSLDRGAVFFPKPD